MVHFLIPLLNNLNDIWIHDTAFVIYTHFSTNGDAIWLIDERLGVSIPRATFITFQ